MSLTHLDPDQHDWMRDPRTIQVMTALGGEADKARFVGGCVRNTLQGHSVDDIDIATVFTPEEVMSRARDAGLNPVPTGLDHGTITVICDHKPFEVTTLRRDVSTDGRRAVVAFTQDWAEDAARRDFTLNAIYLSQDGSLYDPHNGTEAARDGRIVFIGDPDQRLAEDYLRLLRFYRFNAWYGRGPLDETSHAACVRVKEKLWSLSAERIWAEFKKFLSAPDPSAALQAMSDDSVLGEVLDGPGHVELSLQMIAQDQAENREIDPLLRLTALLGADPVRCDSLLNRMKASSAERSTMAGYCLYQPDPVDLESQRFRLWMYQHSPYAKGQLRLAEASGHLTGEAVETALKAIANWQAPVFPVSGKDLLASGHEPGPEMGQTLSRLETLWIESDFSLTRDELLDKV